jgi:hypothetical protein
MNAEIGAEAAQFPGKEYINGIAVAVYKRMLGLWEQTHEGQECSDFDIGSQMI